MREYTYREIGDVDCAASVCIYIRTRRREGIYICGDRLKDNLWRASGQECRSAWCDMPPPDAARGFLGRGV